MSYSALHTQCLGVIIHSVISDATGMVHSHMLLAVDVEDHHPLAQQHMHVVKEHHMHTVAKDATVG